MTNKYHIFTCLTMLVAGSFSNPVKRTVENQGALLTDADVANGEQGFEVMFPGEFTEAILSALPNIEGSQTQIVTLLNQTLKTSQHHGEQIKNLTSTMTILLSNVVNLLGNFVETGVDQMSTTPSSTDPPTPSFPIDCHDIEAGGHLGTGVFTIMGSMEVHCDMDTDDGPWTVIQKRYDGSVDFYRGWSDYDRGFGVAHGEYWLGLQNIRRLISLEGTSWQLRIELTSHDRDGSWYETAYALYDSFTIGDAASNYTLSVGTYSGTAGNSLNTPSSDSWIHNGMQFSTHDRDNDHMSYSSGNCASESSGGWWYNNCFAANLNGRFIDTKTYADDGIIWYNWKRWDTLRSSQMKIRRVV